MTPEPVPLPPMRRGLSLEHRLPLLITTLLLLVLGVALVVTYGEMMRASRIASAERLQRMSHELATSAAASTQQHALLVRELGADSVVRRALAGVPPDSGVLEDRLRGLLAIEDSLGVVELLGPRGRPVWKSPAAAAMPGGTAGIVPARADSARYGPLYADGGRVHYWVVAPVVRRDRRLGWVVERRRVVASPEMERRIRGFVGRDAAVYLTNDTGSFWATLAGSPASPPRATRLVNGLRTRVRADRPGAGRVFAAESPVGGTPWTLALEVPVSVATVGPRASFMRLAIFSLVLLAVAAVVAWAISRRLTRPLIELTEAAETIARGDYTRRIDVTRVMRGDEIGRLAAGFNHMVDEVAASHAQLEQQMEEAQALSEELEGTNAQLRESTLEAELARDEAEAARREAETANQVKAAFLATMSHELRTPLNAIAGYTSLLVMGVRGPITPEQHADLERIRRSQRSLLALVDDVLSFARIEAGRVQYRMADIPLDATLAGLEALVAPQLREKQITYEYRPAGPDARLWADREKLERILLNLLSNAVKFTEPGGRITVESELRADAAFVHVTDTGCGIAPDKLDSIFEPFTQAETGLTRTSEGTGLGLAISREFAQGMGGDLTVRSTPARGSTFTLRLPARPSSRGGGPAPSARGGTDRVDGTRA